MSTTTEPLELSPYSPLWPAVFDMEKRRLLEVLGADLVLVEHIGSTAVPGLGGKPVIDVMVGAPALAIVERRIPQLEAEGYRYVPEFERAMPQRRYFVKENGHPGTFHVHAVLLDSPFWKDHLAFRDALRADPALAERYWQLKRRLAARFRHDRGAYADAKGEFIRAAIAKG